jgi:hypothetical protein
MKNIAYKIAGGLVVAVITMQAFGQGPYEITGLVMDNPSQEVNPHVSHINWDSYTSSVKSLALYEFNPKFIKRMVQEHYKIRYNNGKIRQTGIHAKYGMIKEIKNAMKAAGSEIIPITIQNGRYKGWNVSVEKEEIPQKTGKLFIYYNLTLQKGKENRTPILASESTLVDK